ncbi:phenylalanine--tRNA ligase subunit alpha [Bacillota bacterium LX-D]|nr:phenylalanine--tRNA ligase subunit alpha [Bacillota bacterium LX-D]
MREQLEQIRKNGRSELVKAENLDILNELRVKYLGKKGLLTQVLRGMGNLTAEERPVLGQLANQVRNELEAIIVEQREKLQHLALELKLAQETIDVTLPGRVIEVGNKHPLTLILDEMKSIFSGMGFTVAEGPEIELDYYNFEALNLPKDHPARDMQDSFYISEDTLLRTHTSPVQARVMEKMTPQLPVKIISPGKVYRRDDDATHSPMFHQVEGLLVDTNVTFADLKGILLAFVKQMFGEEQKIRLRPSYFPFTEPSAEVDIACVMCGGKGCRVCKDSGWLEILGSGMVHPRVLEMSGYDPEKVTGFAFGMGIERIAMLKYGIDDLRLLFDNDLRFIKQFR